MSHAETLRLIAKDFLSPRSLIDAQDVTDLSAACLAGARALEAHQWQPIETAPRPTGGRRKVIDVWCVTDDHESAQFYFGDTMCGVAGEARWQGRVCEVYWREGAWRPVSGLQRHALTVTPTHWMPVPSSPALSSLEGSGVIEKQM